LNSNGGGIYNNNASPTISNCVFINNESGSDGYFGSYAYSGGAIYNYNWSNPSIINCVFRANQASGNGGAICNVNSSSSSIVNCQFETNVAEKGGAIYIASLSSCSLSGCTFQQNLATFYGGAVYLLENCEVSISASNFEANYSDLGGGGIYNQGGILTVASCSFNQNISLPGNGGGIDLLGGGTATISNSEFTSNSAISGGGIFISTTSWLEMSFSMFCENIGGDVVGNWADLGGNEINASCDGTDGACCTNDICVLTDSETCNFVGGKFQGLKTICSEELCPTSCPGDLNGDGQVNVNDLMILIAYWGVCP
jgi:predicted outer membrane repeat protein